MSLSSNIITCSFSVVFPAILLNNFVAAPKSSRIIEPLPVVLNVEEFPSLDKHCKEVYCCCDALLLLLLLCCDCGGYVCLNSLEWVANCNLRPIDQLIN